MCVLLSREDEKQQRALNGEVKEEAHLKISFL